MLTFHAGLACASCRMESLPCFSSTCFALLYGQDRLSLPKESDPFHPF